MRCGARSVMLLALLALASSAAAQKTLSSLIQGATLTFYGGAPDGMDPNSPSYGTKDGSCGYGLQSQNAYPYFAVAALSPNNQFYKQGPLNGCGQCFRLTCTDSRPGVCKMDSNGKPQYADVQITDSCPECEADHIDVQALSFAKIAVPSFGRIQISYQRIECTPPTDLKVAVMDFKGAGQWLRLSIDDTGGRGSVQSVQVKSSSSGAWTQLSNSWGATWETSSAPSAPLDFKIQCDDGEAVVASGVIKQNGGISVGAFGDKKKFSTGVQFTFSGSSSSSSSSSTASSSGSASGSSSGSDRVSAFSGPADGSSDNGSSSACVDVPAPGSFSCQQQKGWGKCQDSSFKANGYCKLTCGACSGNSGSSGGQPSSSPSSPPAPSPSGSSSCDDKQAPGGYSCKQQKDWGKCDDQFITSGGFCRATCGACSGSSSSGSGKQPSVQSFSGPSGRRLLRS